MNEELQPNTHEYMERNISCQTLGIRESNKHFNHIYFCFLPFLRVFHLFVGHDGMYGYLTLVRGGRRVS